MPLAADDLAILRRELSELPTTRPRTVTKQRAIAEPALAPAQRRHYTVEDLAQLLADRGLAMSAGSLRGYLLRNRKRRRAGKPGAVASQQSTGPRWRRACARRHEARTRATQGPPVGDGGGLSCDEDGLERPRPKT
jgi:hypothetical protein